MCMGKWMSYLMSVPYISFDNFNTIGQKRWWSIEWIFDLAMWSDMNQWLAVIRRARTRKEREQNRTNFSAQFSCEHADIFQNRHTHIMQSSSDKKWSKKMMMRKIRGVKFVWNYFRMIINLLPPKNNSKGASAKIVIERVLLPLIYTIKEFENHT